MGGWEEEAGPDPSFWPPEVGLEGSEKQLPITMSGSTQGRDQKGGKSDSRWLMCDSEGDGFSRSSSSLTLLTESPVRSK